MVAMNAAHPFRFSQGEADAARTQTGRNTRRTRRALTGQAQRRRPVRAKCSQSQHPQVDRLESFWRGLAFVPAIQWAKRMQETLLDFDNADASGDRGAVIPLKSEDRRQKIAHSRNVRYAARMVDAESSRPGPELSNGAAAGTRAFRVERT